MRQRPQIDFFLDVAAAVLMLIILVANVLI